MFEFDKVKSLTNKEKHGIDFIEAQLLWEDSKRIIIPSKNISEPRFLLIAEIDDNIWTAIYTIRAENIRIISVRKARSNEKEIYQSI